MTESEAKRTLPPWVVALFTPRLRPAEARIGSQNPLRFVDLAVFALYAAILAFAIHHHLASDDEAQAWLLARDNSLYDLLFRRMHYEGGPGLWPLILWAAIRMHLPYAAISYLSSAPALAGVLVWLRFSPFPLIFRWLIPFTFFVQYQYAVIARPYAFFPLLLFMLCVVYTDRRPRPVLFALLAGLMVNISLHAAMLAGFFALLYLRELYRPPRQSTLFGRTPPGRRQVVLAATLFITLSVFSAVVAAPAPDVCTDGNPGDTTGKTHLLLRKLMPTQQLPPGAPPIDPYLEPSLLPPNAPHPDPNYKPNHLALILVRSIIVGGDSAFFPISESNLLASAFLIALYCWFRVKGRLDLLLPYAFTIALAAQVVVFDHHTGMFLLALVAAVWIALETHAPAAAPGESNGYVAPLLASLALLVTLLQIGWTAHTVYAESKRPYDPGLATERYLTEHFSGKRIAGFGYATVTTQAFAPHSLFFNQPHAFWVWSAPVSINRRYTEALEQHPEVVVLEDFVSRRGFFYNQFGPTYSEGQHAFRRHREFWEQHGYRLTHEFCGERFMRFSESHSACELILEPDTHTEVGPGPNTHKNATHAAP
jgi:hypothetical protein